MRFDFEAVSKAATHARPAVTIARPPFAHCRRAVLMLLQSPHVQDRPPWARKMPRRRFVRASQARHDVLWKGRESFAQKRPPQEKVQTVVSWPCSCGRVAESDVLRRHHGDLDVARAASRPQDV